jgi:PGAP1-like protein
MKRVAVRGGAGGISVALEALEQATGCLRAAAGSLTEAAERTTRAGVDADLVASELLSPMTAVRAGVAVAVAAGPAGVGGEAAQVALLAAAVRAAVIAYRAADEATARSVALAENLVMAVAGSHVPEVAVGVLALQAVGVDGAALLDDAAYELPELAELGGGTEGLVLGLQSDRRTAPLLAPGLARHAPPGGEPADYEHAVRVLADSASAWGLLSDRGRPRATLEATPRPGAQAPTSVADLARDQATLADAAAHPARVRVIEVPQERGAAWIVEIPGTQVWDPRAGKNPFDVTSDVRQMGQESTILAKAVTQALDAAQAASAHDTSSDPVLLTGHSLGGIVAAGLAATPQFRASHRVTHVVTMGSPVARMPIPPTVSVLSLEHTQDPVPRLDGVANPDRRHWVTVTRDLEGDPDRVHTGSGAHALSEYVETGAAAEGTDDLSMAAWREGSRGFFEAARGEAVIRDYRIERVPPQR